MNKLYEYAFEYVCWHLHIDTEDNLIAVLQECINNGLDIGYDDSLLLSFAMAHRKEKLIKFAIDNGIDVKARNNKPLFEAVSQNNIQLIKLLIEHGSNAENNNLIFSKACEIGNIEIIDLLLSIGTVINDDAITYAKNIDTVKFLVSKGADPFVKNNTLLIQACNRKDLELVEYLVLMGANCTDQNNEAIKMISSDNKPDILSILLKNGADPNSKCRKNSVPILVIFFSRGCVDNCKLLLEYGAIPFISNKTIFQNKCHNTKTKKQMIDLFAEYNFILENYL